MLLQANKKTKIPPRRNNLLYKARVERGTAHSRTKDK